MENSIARFRLRASQDIEFTGRAHADQVTVERI